MPAGLFGCCSDPGSREASGEREAPTHRSRSTAARRPPQPGGQAIAHSRAAVRPPADRSGEWLTRACKYCRAQQRAAAQSAHRSLGQAQKNRQRRFVKDRLRGGWSSRRAIQRPTTARSLVGVRGFEPPTPASRTQYSTRLSYTPIAVRRREREAINALRSAPTTR